MALIRFSFDILEEAFQRSARFLSNDLYDSLA
jgi:hypothetical protein